VGHDLEIIPVLNKIDMDSAMIDEVKDQVIDLIGCREEDILLASGKTGLGVEEVLEAIVQPHSRSHGRRERAVQALIFDSVFNRSAASSPITASSTAGSAKAST
jgi:lepA: GTP-binding protein LepA